KVIYLVRHGPIDMHYRHAGGGGPENVLSVAKKHWRRFEYDRVMSRCVVLMDTDKTWSSAVVANAKRMNIRLVPSRPCLEGLLLRILGKETPKGPSAAKRCKRLFLDDFGASRRATFAKHFPRPVLEEARLRIP